MNDDWSVLRFGMMIHHISNSPAELEQRVRERVRVARPLRVVEQDHLPLLVVLSNEIIIINFIHFIFITPLIHKINQVINVKLKGKEPWFSG